MQALYRRETLESTRVVYGNRILRHDLVSLTPKVNC